MIKVEIEELGIRAEFPIRNMAERFLNWVLEETSADSLTVLIDDGEVEERIIYG